MIKWLVALEVDDGFAVEGLREQVNWRDLYGGEGAFFDKAFEIARQGGRVAIPKFFLRKIHQITSEKNRENSMPIRPESADGVHPSLIPRRHSSSGHRSAAGPGNLNVSSGTHVSRLIRHAGVRRYLGCESAGTSTSAFAPIALVIIFLSG